MSARKTAVVVTTDARSDLTSIALYTAERWGSRQRDVYIERLINAIYDLPRFPGRGRLRPDLSDGIRAYLVEQHVIYYLATDQAVTIVRIRHTRMDASRLFEE